MKRWSWRELILKSKSYKRALRALDNLGNGLPILSEPLFWRKRTLLGDQRKTDEELKYLLKAEGMTLTSRQRTKALERIGRLYMRKDENDLAISYFTSWRLNFLRAGVSPKRNF